MVNDEIAGDARQPSRKLATLGVATLTYRYNGLNESFLKDILCQVAIAGELIDIIVEASTMTA